MPTFPARPLSQDPVAASVLATDRLVVLRTPQAEPDPTQRNLTAGLPQLAAALAGFLPSSFAPFLAAQLNTDKQDYAGLSLVAALLKLTNAALIAIPAGTGFGGFQRESITAWPFTSAFVLPPAAVLGIIVSGSVNLPGIDFTLSADSTGHPVCTPIGAAPNPATYGITLISGLTASSANGSAPSTATY